VAFKVNMSENEAKSEAREALPSGRYHFKFTDMSVEYTKETAKNPNKPYFNFELTVQDSPGPWLKFAGRKDWCNAMLFEPALYTISQILKALGYPVSQGELEIPDDPSFYLTKDIIGIRAPDRKQTVDDGTGKMVPRIQLSGFKQYIATDGSSPAVSGPTSGGGSVLP
jgi:hypothetical protein